MVMEYIDGRTVRDIVESGTAFEYAEARKLLASVAGALGGPTNAPTVTHIQNDWNNVHLLCSDGLTKHVTDDRIRSALRCRFSPPAR
jgi:serine/threonine protein phosphatase PrpC